MAASRLVTDHLLRITGAAAIGQVLDLACGRGRNGLYLLQHGIPVVFADLAPDALQHIRNCLQRPTYREHADLATLWQVDLEQPATRILQPSSHGAILVFRYLHRALLPQIKAAVRPGGLVMYETFTVHQAALGRPKNPEFLLNPGELLDYFNDWQIIHAFEGMVDSTDDSARQAIAQVIACKPGGTDDWQVGS